MPVRIALLFCALVSIAAGGHAASRYTANDWTRWGRGVHWGSSFWPDAATDLADYRPHRAPMPEQRQRRRARSFQAAPSLSSGLSGDSESTWDCIKGRESGGDYANKRNPNYRGAFQFSYSTWRSVGGRGDPADASPAEQDARARELQRRSGWGQWSTAGACGV